MSTAVPPYPERLEIQPLARAPRQVVQVPGSKSITNRALVLAALTAKGYACALRGALRSEDTEVMIDGLRALGFRVLTEWPQALVVVSSGAVEPTIPAAGADLFVGNSGTTMRFLTALVSLGHGRYRLDGVPRMRQRPIADLLGALQQLGVVAYSENDDGCPPVVVLANGLKGGHVRLKGNVSSQFLSGLLLAAPYAHQEVALEVDGPLVSWPYVFMTGQMLRQWGLKGWPSRELPAKMAWLEGDRRAGGERIFQGCADLRINIPGRQYETVRDYREVSNIEAIREGQDPREPVWLRDYSIEPDATAASYFLGAAAVTGGEITIAGLPKHSLQGDVRFAEVLEDMGCEMARTDQSLLVRGGLLRGIDVDMNDISDTVMTLAAVACFAQGPTTIRNVAHIRQKETDRLAALATELRRIGATVDEFADGLTITPGPLHGAEIETYLDHRMAMSLALVGLKVPGILLKNPGCVAKTYPCFFEDLEKLRT